MLHPFGDHLWKAKTSTALIGRPPDTPPIFQNCL